MRRSARTVRTPARLAEEALPIVSVDDSSDASGDDGLHQQIAELHDQYYSGFDVYASVYVECHPSESPSWFTYMANAMDLHRRHERFRRIRANISEFVSWLYWGSHCWTQLC